MAVSKEPPGDAGQLSRPPVLPASPNVVDRHRFWGLPGHPQAVLQFIDSHRPAGSVQFGSGFTSGPGRPLSTSVYFSWPPIRGVAGTRWLTVEAIALTHGSTALRADAEVIWLLPRPASEQLPGAARVLDVTVGRPRAAPSVSILVTNRPQVDTIAAMIDRLAIVQPGAVSCPAQPAGAPVVTFTFRAQLHGPSLAQASELAEAQAFATPCDALSLTIHGRVQPALLAGGPLLRRIQAVLGVTLAR